MQKINTIELFETVLAELRKHRSGGYFPQELVNRLLRSAELSLFLYFRGIYERTQEISEHLQPFIVNGYLGESNDTGLLPFPSDYAFRAAIEGLYLENPTTGGATVKKSYPCYYLDAGEFAFIQSDAIAYPSRKKKRFYHTLTKDGIQLLPKEKLYTLVHYIKYPVYGSIVYTLTHDEDSDQDVLQYDTAASVNMEWNMITFPLFKSLLLEYFGVSIKDPYVMQYVNLPKINA